MNNHRLQYAPPSPPHHHQHIPFLNYNLGAPDEIHQQGAGVGVGAAGPYHYHGVFPRNITQTFPTNTMPPQYHHQLLHEQNGDNNGTYYSGPDVGLAAAYGISYPTSSAAQGVALPNTDNPSYFPWSMSNSSSHPPMAPSFFPLPISNPYSYPPIAPSYLPPPRSPVPSHFPLPVSNPSSYPPIAPSSLPNIGPLEKPDKDLSRNARNAKKRKAAAVEDLESKVTKVLKGGAAASALQTCVFCNVVCNSKTAFNQHIAGQRHAAMLKKLEV